MPSIQLSCPHCSSLLSFGHDVAVGTPVPCLICGQSFNVAAPPAIAAPPPVPMAMFDSAGVRPAPVLAPPPADTRMLLTGGLVFAGVALLMLGGMGVVLWMIFGQHPTDLGGPATPVVVQIPGKGATADPAPNQGKNAPPGRDVDVADLKKVETPRTGSPLDNRVIRAGGDPEPGPGALPAPVMVIAPGGIPGVDQQRIDAAIDRGVRYLKGKQAEDGTWPGGPDIGFTALAGLTLLECKVPADDPTVVKAAGHIRHSVGVMNRSYETYQLSLAILFLDRLGNPKDKVLIQGMAMRLIAGQNDAGGWTYRSQHILTPPEMQKLLVFLKSHRPPTPLPKALNPAGALAKQTTTSVEMLPRQVQNPADDPFKQLADLLQMPKSDRESAGPGDPKDSKVNKPIEGNPPAADPAKKPDAASPKDAKPDKPSPTKKIAPIPLNRLPLHLQQLPAARLSAAKGKAMLAGPHGEDNSNTQFALMGLWAARRHEVPAEYTLGFAQQRFIRSQNKDKSQNKDGGWGYHVGHTPTDTMTCVGLIGLAMGHGIHADVGKDKAKQQDLAIQDGLRALGRYVGTPSQEPNAEIVQPNLYFLWSLERVAMLYDLKTIGGKDWYGWGAQALLANQQAKGNWSNGRYHAASDHTDTCFALLFLKRSNLVPDLTENLRLYMVIRDPEAR